MLHERIREFAEEPLAHLVVAVRGADAGRCEHAAQPWGFLHEDHVHAEPGRLNRRAHAARAAADHQHSARAVFRIHYRRVHRGHGRCRRVLGRQRRIHCRGVCRRRVPLIRPLRGLRRFRCARHRQNSDYGWEATFHLKSVGAKVCKSALHVIHECPACAFSRYSYFTPASSR